MLKILFLCNKSPFPAREGGPMAMNSLIEGMFAAGHKIKVLAVNSDKYNVKQEDIPDEYKKKTGIELVHIDLNIKPWDAFLNLFTNKSYHVERFISTEFKQKLIQLLGRYQFDVVQLESLFMVPYVKDIRAYSKAKIVLRAHNIEHLIWQRLTYKTNNVFKKKYLHHLTSTLKRYELKALNQVDGIAAITRKDAAYFRGLTSTPVTDIPFGIEAGDFVPAANLPQTPSLFHIGAMNWLPNVEGIRWFLDHAWEEIHKNHPELKFYLAGRYMPDWLVTGYRPNIIVVGEVDDAKQFVNSNSIAIVPLLSGSGIRIKIIEAMALGKTVITTEIGAEGIFYSHNVNIIIANNHKEFIEAVNKCLAQPDFLNTVGKNARRLIEQMYNNHEIVSRLELFLKEIKKSPIKLIEE